MPITLTMFIVWVKQLQVQLLPVRHAMDRVRLIIMIVIFVVETDILEKIYV